MADQLSDHWKWFIKEVEQNGLQAIYEIAWPTVVLFGWILFLIVRSLINHWKWLNG